MLEQACSTASLLGAPSYQAARGLAKLARSNIYCILWCTACGNLLLMYSSDDIWNHIYLGIFRNHSAHCDYDFVHCRSTCTYLLTYLLGKWPSVSVQCVKIVWPEDQWQCTADVSHQTHPCRHVSTGAVPCVRSSGHRQNCHHCGSHETGWVPSFTWCSD